MDKLRYAYYRFLNLRQIWHNHGRPTLGYVILFIFSHMTLPYGTMKDKEMLAMRVDLL